jgi:hypothetical protein
MSPHQLTGDAPMIITLLIGFIGAAILIGLSELGAIGG